MSGSFSSSSSSVGDMRCIAHLDMDCFYAQVEAVRLGIDCRTKPLILSQWNLLIAVNYPARAYGIKRGQHNTQDAMELCPDVVVALSPSYKMGNPVSAYYPNPTREHYKISLEPYRQASRQIFAILASEPGVKVEKAGVDEAFVDVTEAAEKELAGLRAASRDGGASLDALADVMEPSTRLIADRRDEMAAWFAQRGTSLAAVFDDPVRALLRGAAGSAVEGSRGFCADAADATYAARCRLLCAASRVVHRLRQRIYAELHYDCSAGIAHNRVLAKCISATHKPNQQTLLLPDRTASALFDLPFKKIRGFGGKFGSAVSAVCGGATECRELWLVPLPQLYALDGASVRVDDEDRADGGSGGGAEDDDGENSRGGAAGLSSGKRIHLKKPYTGTSSSLHAAPSRRDDADLVNHDTSLYAFYRMRGVASDCIVNRPLSKSLIASKNFGFLTSHLDTVQQWVVVLCGELACRYDEFTALYHLRGRSWNIKVGNEGFRRMGGVLNTTVALPDAVRPDILAALTLRELQALFARRPTPTADSVTLTIAGFVSDNSGSTGAVPTLDAVSGLQIGNGFRSGGGGGGAVGSLPPRQQTLDSFFSPVTSTTTAAAAAATVSLSDNTEDVTPVLEVSSDDEVGQPVEDVERALLGDAGTDCGSVVCCTSSSSARSLSSTPIIHSSRSNSNCDHSWEYDRRRDEGVVGGSGGVQGEETESDVVPFAVSFPRRTTSDEASCEVAQSSDYAAAAASAAVVVVAEARDDRKEERMRCHSPVPIAHASLSHEKEPCMLGESDTGDVVCVRATPQSKTMHHLTLQQPHAVSENTVGTSPPPRHLEEYFSRITGSTHRHQRDATTTTPPANATRARHTTTTAAEVNCVSTDSLLLSSVSSAVVVDDDDVNSRSGSEDDEEGRNDSAEAPSVKRPKTDRDTMIID